MAQKFTRRRWRRPERLTLEHPPVVRRKDFGAPEPLPLEPELARRANRNRIFALRATFAVLVVVQVAVVAYFLPVVAAALVIALFGYLEAGRRLGDRWVRHAIGARVVEAPRLERLVRNTAKEAGIRQPNLLVVPGERPNAMTFRARISSLTITSGTLDLDDLVLEGIVAHEIVHLRDGDAALQSEFVLIAGAPDLAVRTLGTGIGILAWLGLPLWPISIVIRSLRKRWFPADREHRADVAAALLTRYPPGIAEGLQVATGGRIPGPGLLAGFWFSPADPHRAELVAEM